MFTKYYLGDQITENEMSRATASMRERGGGYWLLVGKSEEKRPLGRLRPRWEDSFKMDVKKVGLGVHRIHLVQYKDRW
jgi:hypothetical protein